MHVLSAISHTKKKSLEMNGFMAKTRHSFLEYLQQRVKRNFVFIFYRSTKRGKDVKIRRDVNRNFPVLHAFHEDAASLLNRIEGVLAYFAKTRTQSAKKLIISQRRSGASQHLRCKKR